MFKLIKASNK